MNLLSRAAWIVVGVGVLGLAGAFFSHAALLQSAVLVQTSHRDDSGTRVFDGAPFRAIVPSSVRLDGRGNQNSVLIEREHAKDVLTAAQIEGLGRTAELGAGLMILMGLLVQGIIRGRGVGGPLPPP